jgi:uncharacterized protein
MAGYFVDSSALVKRYVQEGGTSWVRRLMRRRAGNPIYVARITTVEVTAAVARRRKGRTLTFAKASSILHRLRQHLPRRYTVIEITPALLNNFMRLANANMLRAYDAVQLATALEIGQQRLAAGFGPVTLVSSDRDLNAAAIAEGIAVDKIPTAEDLPSPPRLP